MNTIIIALLSLAVEGVFRVACSAFTACVRGASRVFLALALSLSAPAAAYDRATMDIATPTGELWRTILNNKKQEGDIDGVFNTMERDKRTFEDHTCLPSNPIWPNGEKCQVEATSSHLTTYLHFFSSGFGQDHNVVAWLLENGMSPNAVEVLIFNGRAREHTAKTPLDIAYESAKYGFNDYFSREGLCNTIATLKRYGAKTYAELQGGEEEVNPCDLQPVAPAEPKADYTGLYANAAFALAGAFTPSWVDTQTFAFNEGNNFITGQSLSIPLDDFTFAATRVQVNDLTDYEFAVRWEMEF